MKNSQTLHVLELTRLQVPDYFSLNSLDWSTAKSLHTLGIPNDHRCFQASLSGLYTWLSVCPRHRSWKSKDPEILVTQQVPPDCQRIRSGEESKMVWLVIEIESSLLIFFHALHFRIVFLILFSYLHKRQHLGDGHIKKNAPKCNEIRYAFNKPFFFPLDVEIHRRTEASWEQKAWFLICLTFWYEAVKIIMLAKEWLCRCSICSSKSGPCQGELE